MQYFEENIAPFNKDAHSDSKSPKEKYERRHFVKKPSYLNIDVEAVKESIEEDSKRWYKLEAIIWLMLFLLVMIVFEIPDAVQYSLQVTLPFMPKPMLSKEEIIRLESEKPRSILYSPVDNTKFLNPGYVKLAIISMYCFCLIAYSFKITDGEFEKKYMVIPATVFGILTPIFWLAALFGKYGFWSFLIVILIFMNVIMIGQLALDGINERISKRFGCRKLAILEVKFGLALCLELILIIFKGIKETLGNLSYIWGVIYIVLETVYICLTVTSVRKENIKESLYILTQFVSVSKNFALILEAIPIGGWYVIANSTLVYILNNTFKKLIHERAYERCGIKTDLD